MSAISNYIHLHRESYMQYGTYQSKDQKTNYDTGVFQKFRRDVVNRSQHLSSIKNTKKLAEEYNKARDEKMRFLKNIIQYGKQEDYLRFIEQVLKAADLDKKYSANQVAKYVFLNEKTGTLDVQQIVKRQDSTEHINIPKIHAQHYVYLETLLNHIRLAKNKINFLKEASLKTELQNRLTNYIEVPLLRLKEKALQGENLIEQIELKYSVPDIKIIDVYVTVANNQPAFTGIEGIKIAENINNEIIKIASVVNIGGIMSNIRGAFEEILGTMAAPMCETIVEEELSAMMDQVIASLKHGTQGSSTGSMQIKEVQYLNQKELSRDKYKNFVTTLANGDLTFALNYDTKNKADFTITAGNQAIGVSAKAVNLSKDDISVKDRKTIPAHITVQSGTNLLSYLLKAETLMNKIGTHFLNVYATENGAMNSFLRDQADEALLFYLLYTGLSGDILKQVDKAGLLYIYDTGKSASGSRRVNFLSIPEIIADLLKKANVVGGDNLQNYIYISPELDSVATRLSQANEKVNDYNTIGENISARLIRVLGEARTTIFTVGLKNTYIKSLINQK